MFTHLTNTTKSIIFYAIALALALIAARLPGITANMYMFTPLAATALMLFVVTRDGYTKTGLQSLGLQRLGLRRWGAAVLIPLLALAVAYGVVWAIGLADLVIPATLDGMPVSVWLLPALAVLFIVKVTLTNGLGEELGWRGYLLPRLESLGWGWAMLLTGLLQAVWHLPFIFSTTLYHAEGNRFLTIPLLFLSITLVEGFFLGYLRLTTGSIWPASLAHAANNVFWLLFGGFTVGATPLVSEYLAGESGILTLAAYALLVSWWVYRLHRRGARAALIQISSSKGAN
jgi:membrane protease YdiL (CAAX protease family)